MSSEAGPKTTWPVWVIMFLLVVLVAATTFLAYSQYKKPAETQVAPDLMGYDVMPISDGKYVMRVNQKIFYCVNNACTTIQDVSQAIAQGRAGGQVQEPPQPEPQQEAE